MVKLKALMFTAGALLWGLASVGAAVYDLSPLFQSWQTIRIVIWVFQFLVTGAAVFCWIYERPRQVRADVLPEPPAMHSL